MTQSKMKVFRKINWILVSLQVSSLKVASSEANNGQFVYSLLHESHNSVIEKVYTFAGADSARFTCRRCMYLSF